jgi:hypothetical protein
MTMGYNTAALVLNDAIGAIANDSEIGARISRQIALAGREKGDVTAHGAAGIHIGAIQVLPPQHADSVQIVAVGGNCIRSLGYSGRWEPEDLLRDLARQLGYSLRKLPAKEPS